MFKSSSLSNTNAKDNNQIGELRFTARIDERDGYSPQQTLTTERHKTLVEAIKYLIDYARVKKIEGVYYFFYVTDVKAGQEFEFKVYADQAYEKYQLQEYPDVSYSAEFRTAFNTAIAQEKAASSAPSASSASSALSSSSYAYHVFSNLLGYGSPSAAAKPAAKASSSHAAAAASSPASALPYVQLLPPPPKLPSYKAASARMTIEDAFRCCVSSINDANGEQLKQIIEAYPDVIKLKSTDKHACPLIISLLYKVRTMADALPSVTQDSIEYKNKILSLLHAAMFIIRHDAFDYKATDAAGNTPMHRAFWYAIHVEDSMISESLLRNGLEMLEKIRSAEFRAILNQKNRSNESCRNNIELTDALRSRFTPNQQRNYSRLQESLRTALLFIDHPAENKSCDFAEKSFVEHYEETISDGLISFDLMQSPLIDQETGNTLDKTTWEDLRDQGKNHPITGVPFTEESYRKLMPNKRVKELTELFNKHKDDVEKLFEEALRYMSDNPLTTLEEKFDLDPQLKSVYQLIQQYAAHKANLAAASAQASSPVVLAPSVAAAAAQSGQQSALSYSANQAGDVMFNSSFAQEKPASALSVAFSPAAPAAKSSFFSPSSALSISRPEEYHVSSMQADRLLAELVVRLSRNNIISINIFVDRYVKKLPDNYQTVFMSYLREAKERYQSQYAEGFPEKDHLVWLRLITQGDKLLNTLSLLLHVESIEVTAVGDGEDIDYRVMLTHLQKEFIEEILGDRLVFLQAPKPHQ